jgi:hypothetical protein
VYQVILTSSAADRGLVGVGFVSLSVMVADVTLRVVADHNHYLHTSLFAMDVAGTFPEWSPNVT